MAAGLMRKIAGDTVQVYSAGTNPGAAVNDLSAQALAEVGVDITGNTPTLIDPVSSFATSFYFLLLLPGRTHGRCPAWSCGTPTVSPHDGRIMGIRQLTASKPAGSCAGLGLVPPGREMSIRSTDGTPFACRCLRPGRRLPDRADARHHLSIRPGVPDRRLGHRLPGHRVRPPRPRPQRSSRRGGYTLDCSPRTSTACSTRRWHRVSAP